MHRSLTESTTDVGQRILIELAHRGPSSADELAAHIVASRNDVSAALANLQRLGFPVCQNVAGQFDVASGWAPLNPASIAAKVSPRSMIRSIHCAALLPSTNDYVAECVARERGDADGRVCLAEFQTSGRGRRGRRWVSPPGANLPFSLVRMISRDDLAAWSGVGLAIAVALCEGLETHGIAGVKIKWPNDLYWEGRKLGGILIETIPAGVATTALSAGVGLNVAFPEPERLAVDQPLVDLAQVAGQALDRNAMAATCIDRVSGAISAYQTGGLFGFVDGWRQRDWLCGRVITARGTVGTVTGMARGIDETGALLLETDAGIESIHGGDVSIRVTGSHAP